MSFENYKVLLIGVSSYSSDKGPGDIPNIDVNISKLESLFTNADFVGIKSNNIKTLNSRKSTEFISINTTLSEFIASATSDDTLIIYYSGHGITSTKNLAVYLSTSQTQTGESLEGTSIKIDTFKDAISTSYCKKKIIILDCCYSGAIIGTMSGAAIEKNIQAQLKKLISKGTFIMASSDEYTPSLYDASRPAVPTDFTQSFISVIQNGISDSDEFCTVEDVFTEISIDLRNKNSPMPKKLGYEFGGNLIISKNKKHTPLQENLEIDPLISISIPETASELLPNKEALEHYNKIIQNKINEKPVVTGDGNKELNLIIKRWDSYLMKIISLSFKVNIWIPFILFVLIFISFAIEYYTIKTIPNIFQYISIFFFIFLIINILVRRFYSRNYSLPVFIEETHDLLSNLSKCIGTLRGQMRKNRTLSADRLKEIETLEILIKKAKTNDILNQLKIMEDKRDMYLENTNEINEHHSLLSVYHRFGTILYSKSEVVYDQAKSKYGLIKENSKIIPKFDAKKEAYYYLLKVRTVQNKNFKEAKYLLKEYKNISKQSLLNYIEKFSQTKS